MNGLNSMNGLNVANGLNSMNGLATTSGYMTTEHGRMVVQYMARCALASGDSLVKQDQYGKLNFTFPGSLRPHPVLQDRRLQQGLLRDARRPA